MKIIEKITAKNKDIKNAPPITIAFIGDSVTHGCFECFWMGDGNLDTRHDTSSAYPTRVREMLNVIYPRAQINIINSGVSGDNARGGNARFERDVEKYAPDLVVISFGLNDAGGGDDNLPRYRENLAGMFEKTAAIGAECIFLTENMMCTKVSCHVPDDKSKALAEYLSRTQNSGMLKKYFEAGKEVARAHGVTVCDIYSAWEKMSDGGVDVTELLANKFNHPIEKMHYYTALKLIETMFSM